jgi:hypothetical protein
VNTPTAATAVIRLIGTIQTWCGNYGFIRTTLPGPDWFASAREIATGWAEPGKRCTFVRGRDLTGRPAALDVQIEDD